MRVLNLVFVVVAVLAAAGGYLQERRRLSAIRRMAPEEARRVYDAAQRTRERLMVAVTVALVLGAVIAVATRPTP